MSEYTDTEWCLVCLADGCKTKARMYPVQLCGACWRLGIEKRELISNALASVPRLVLVKGGKA